MVKERIVFGYGCGNMMISMRGIEFFSLFTATEIGAEETSSLGVKYIPQFNQTSPVSVIQPFICEL